MNAYSIPELLDVLARAPELETRSVDDTPLIVVRTFSGADHAGWLRQRGGDSIALEAADGSYIMVDVDRIESISVPDAAEYADVLSDGREERPRVAVPGVLAVQRRAQEIAGHLRVDVEIPPVDADVPKRRIALTRQLEALETVLASIFDEHGEAARAAFAIVRLEDAADAGVRTEDGKLIVAADLGGGPRGRLGRDALRGAIEAAH